MKQTEKIGLKELIAIGNDSMVIEGIISGEEVKKIVSETAVYFLKYKTK